MSRAGERRAGAGLVAACALLASLPFARHDALVRDDAALLASPPGVAAAFRGDAWQGAASSSGLYRPLPRALDGLVARAFGLGGRPQKAVSSALHALASVASLRVAVAAGAAPPVALLGALLFAAHPAHGEVFGEVAGRAEILAALFSLAALLALRRGTPLALAVGFAAACAAGLSKESALALPAIALLFPGPTRGRLVNAIVCGTAAAAVLGLRHAVLGSALGLDPSSVPLVDNPIAALPFVEGRRFALAVLAQAGALLAMPVRLSADWSYGSIAPPASYFDPRVLAGSALVLFCLAAAVAAWRTRRPAAFFAAAAFLSFVPASQLVVRTGALFGERLLYLPSLFFAIACAPLVLRAGRLPLAIVLLAFLVRCGAHSADFESNARLYRAADSSRPGGAKPPAVLAHEARLAGDLATALAEVDRALAVLPSYETAITLRAAILAESGRPAEAAAALRALVDAGRGDFETWWNLAQAYRAGGDRASAAAAFREAMRADPRERERCERAIRALGE